MFVRTLIGRQAGQIIELPFHAAQNAIDTGTAQPVSDAELKVAGLAIEPEAVVQPDTFPPGYKAVPIMDGFDVFLDDNEKPLNEHLIPNLAAARSFATDHAAAVVKAQKTDPRATREPGAADVPIPEEWQSVKFNEGLSTLAAKLSRNPIKTKLDAFAAIEQEIAWRDEDAAASAAKAASQSNQTAN